MSPAFLEKEKWCLGIFHRLFYGETKKTRTDTFGTHTEWFCKKCGLKRSGITTFCIEIPLPRE